MLISTSGWRWLLRRSIWPAARATGQRWSTPSGCVMSQSQCLGPSTFGGNGSPRHARSLTVSVIQPHVSLPTTIGVLKWEAGDLATMKGAFSIFLSESDRTGQPLNEWLVANTRGWLRMLDGDLDAAEWAIADALALGTAAGQPDALSYFGAQLLGVRQMQGRVHEMVPLIEQAVKDNPGIPGFRAALVWAKSRDVSNEHVSQPPDVVPLDVEVANGFPMSDDAAVVDGPCTLGGDGSPLRASSRGVTSLRASASVAYPVSNDPYHGVRERGSLSRAASSHTRPSRRG